MAERSRIGALLRWVRVNAGASQEQAAELVGVHQVTWSRWELGRADMTLGDARAICEAFDLDPLSFLPAAGFPIDPERRRVSLGEWAEQRREQFQRNGAPPFGGTLRRGRGPRQPSPRRSDTPGWSAASAPSRAPRLGRTPVLVAAAG